MLDGFLDHTHVHVLVPYRYMARSWTGMCMGTWMCTLASVCAGDIPLEGVCGFVGLIWVEA